MIADADLRALDVSVDGALRHGSDPGVRVLGYGEISMVLAWPVDEPRLACKRLPVFDTPERFARYESVFLEYIADLVGRGVPVVETDLRSVERDDGTMAAYCLQPVLPADSLAPNVLAHADEADSRRLLAAIVEATGAAVDERVGLDGQLSNWANPSGTLAYLDVTTPLARDESGRDLLDVELFTAALPWLARGPVKRFMLSDILDKYFQFRGVITDLAGNLIKERLEHWVPEVVALTAGRVEPPLTVVEVRHYYRGDARTWRFLEVARRADKWWQQTVRRRPYPFLLPPRLPR